MTRSEFLVFGAPQIKQAEIDEVIATLESGWLGTGPRTARFEESFAQYKSSPVSDGDLETDETDEPPASGDPLEAIAVNSCTAALHLSLICAGIGPGDEVITTALTFCSTVNTILHVGATPVLADVDPDTQNIDPDDIARKITDRTKAIIPVHFAGRMCDMDRIMALAGRHNLKVIEDCAHAIETYDHHGRRAGTIGDFGCFSFYVTKNVVTGEGGMVLTRNEEDAARIRRLRLHGLSRDAWNRFGQSGYRHYQVVECGYKYNMTDLQAALGLHQLQRVDFTWKDRRKIWRSYNARLEHLPLTLPAPFALKERHAFHLYTVLIDPARCGIDRDSFLKRMTAEQIGVGVHYLSIADHPYYQDALGMKPEDTPHATRIGRQTVSLPISPKMNADRDVDDVVSAITTILETDHEQIAV